MTWPVNNFRQVGRFSIGLISHPHQHAGNVVVRIDDESLQNTDALPEEIESRCPRCGSCYVAVCGVESSYPLLLASLRRSERQMSALLERAAFVYLECSEGHITCHRTLGLFGAVLEIGTILAGYISARCKAMAL